MKINYVKLVATAFLLGSATFTASSQTILHVKANATGANNGTSWLNAYSSLESAIATARANPNTSYEIWVAGGTYKPTHDPFGNANPTLNGDKTFYLANGVKYYGGFAGTETSLSQRDLSIAANATILSGDLDSSGTPTTGDAYHVVVSINATNTTVFDGFTVTMGYGPSGTQTFIQLQNNYIGRLYGAGMVNYKSSPIISSCHFLNNRTENSGGGIYNLGYSNPVIIGCLFTENSARNGGGISFAVSSSPMISDCIFNNNTATSLGGGIYVLSGDLPLNISNCRFKGNVAVYGGGAYMGDRENIKLHNSVFTENVATNGGGGLLTYAISFFNLTNVIFAGNSAIYGGGLYFNESENYALINNSLFGNKAAKNGGGAYLTLSTGELINTTVASNYADSLGGGIYYSDNAGSYIDNSIIYGNATANTNDINRKEIYKDGTGTGASLIINTTILKDYNSNATNNFSWSTTNSTDDPLFVDPQPAVNAPSITGNYRLQFCSPAINASDSLTNTNGYFLQVGLTDALGNTRMHGNGIDLGAYEKISDFDNFSNNAALNDENSNLIPFLPTCEDGDNWTWYAPVSNPDSLSFAIKWDSANAAARQSATVFLSVLDSNTSATNNTNQAMVTMKRYWNVDLGSTNLAKPVSVRMLFDAADTVAMHNLANSFNLNPVRNVMWFQNSDVLFEPNQVTFDNINNGNYTTLNPTYGIANNIPYVQFDNLTNLKGGTAAIQVGTKPTAIENVAISKGLNIYPNPNNGQFTLAIESTKNVSGNIIIYDIVGRMVHSQEVNNQNTKINTNLVTGVYQVIASIDGKSFTTKLVVE